MYHLGGQTLIQLFYTFLGIKNIVHKFAISDKGGIRSLNHPLLNVYLCFPNHSVSDVI